MHMLLHHYYFGFSLYNYHNWNTLSGSSLLQSYSHTVWLTKCIHKHLYQLLSTVHTKNVCIPLFDCELNEHDASD